MIKETKFRKCKHKFQDTLSDVWDFLKEWGKNTGFIILAILGASLVLGMIGFPIYLACSGFAAHGVWKIVVGAIWIIIDLGLGVTLAD